MKRFSKKLLLDIDEMTAYYKDLGKVLKGASIAAAYNLDNILDIINKNPYFEIINNVIDVNRCFVKVLPTEELLVIKGLVRNQIQNAIWLYAEYLQPLNILERIYYRGKKLNQLPLTQSEVLEKLKIAYPNIPLYEMWLDSCKYVHPTDLNWGYSTKLANIEIFKNEELSKYPKELVKTLKQKYYIKPISFKKVIKPDIDNLYKINQIIVDSAKNLIKHYEGIIRMDKEKIKVYKAVSFRN